MSLGDQKPSEETTTRIQPKDGGSHQSMTTWMQRKGWHETQCTQFHHTGVGWKPMGREVSSKGEDVKARFLARPWTEGLQLSEAGTQREEQPECVLSLKCLRNIQGVIKTTAETNNYVGV